VFAGSVAVFQIGASVCDLLHIAMNPSTFDGSDSCVQVNGFNDLRAPNPRAIGIGRVLAGDLNHGKYGTPGR
jgi:hypothetical protein